MREDRCGVAVTEGTEAAGCLRGAAGDGGCPAVDGLAGAAGGAPAAEEEVEALLGCRGFLWDILLEGRWTGCSRERLRRLCARHGAGAVAAAFEKE